MLDATKNVTFIIGYVRDPDVNYLGDSRQNYWKSACDNDDHIACGCEYAYGDLASADAESRKLDSAIVEHAEAIGGSNYSDIVQLSVRQTFGAMDVTIPDDLDTSDVIVFQKELSSNGNVNTIDVIFALSPILYVVGPEWIRLLTEPVLRYLAPGRWNFDYTVHDIGDHYPNATGNNDGYAESMPVEECGNIILLAYMYQKATGNTDWAAQYTSLFATYADYLIEQGLYPSDQLSSDDGAGGIANQTSLSMKAAIALNAFGIMTSQSKYSDAGLNFANILYNQGAGLDAARTHFTLVQGADDTWTTTYNLYMDILLGLGTFPSQAFTMQSAYYPKVRAEAGLALDSHVDWGKTDWMLWAAAISASVGDKDVGITFLDDVHAYVSNRRNDVPFGDRYYVGTDGSNAAGTVDSYRARPVVGGHFALMALQGPTMFLGDAEEYAAVET